ncbi:hypothetical protein MMC15_003421 [Xylographa vitiligo]|nr:hypothetical protein [Xylographa vitiligo]
MNDRLLAVTVGGEVTPHGMLYNPEMASKSYSSGREYTAMSVREYDKWLTPQRDTIWYATLVESQDNGQYEFLYNPVSILAGTGLDLLASAGFDVSRTGVLFVARQFTIKQGTKFMYNVYYVATSTLTDLGTSKPFASIMSGLEGASSSPVFSPDGQSAAFVQKQKGFYDDDKSHLFLVRSINSSPDTIGMFTSVDASIDDGTYEILDPSTGISKHILLAKRIGATYGLHSSQVREVHFQGAQDHDIHAWVIKPSDFDVSKKYPLLYAIHGGPSNAWNDHWWGGTWNLALFAEQGYVVFAPNITGSTGFGEDFAKRAYINCGGHACEDLVRGLDFVKRKLEFVDTSRAVAVGITYGGYLINWIGGHPLGKEFKALVADFGIFSTLDMYAADNSWFQANLFKGTIHGAREHYERWDPARYVSNWTTPHLIIASELDYQVPITEGLQALHVLQERGVESRFLSFPDEGHLVQKPGNQLHWLRTMLGWCNHYVDPVIQGDREGKVVLGNVVSEPGWRV